jgi:hypothetical protein
MRIAGQITWGVALTLGIWLVACAAADGADFWEEREYGHAGFSFVMAQRVSDYALTGPTYGGFTGEATLGTFLGVRIGGALLFSDQQFGTGPFGVAGSPGNAWELNSVVASLGVGPQIKFGVGPFRLY